MIDFAAARENMVDCQIHTAGVNTPAILEAFASVPREIFAPDQVRRIAYMDEDLPLGEGRYLLEPITHARMIQALAPEPENIVLDIGGATGYSAAVLSSLVTTVIALEDKKKFLDTAEALWESLGVCNAAGVKGRLAKGHPENAPYDLIFMNGAVSEIPEQLVGQLAPEGRLITVVRKSGHGLGQVTLIQNINGKDYAARALFEAGCPYLPGFEPQPGFVF